MPQPKGIEQTDDQKGCEMMQKITWISRLLCGMMALLLLSGCGKPTDTAEQNSTPQTVSAEESKKQETSGWPSTGNSTEKTPLTTQPLKTGRNTESGQASITTALSSVSALHTTSAAATTKTTAKTDATTTDKTTSTTTATTTTAREYGPWVRP